MGKNDYMQTIIGLLVVIHLIGLAVLMGASLALLPAARKGRGFVPELMFHGIAIIFVSGIFLIVAALFQSEVENVAALIIKIVVVMVMVVMILTKRKNNDLTAAFFSAILALTALNVALSIMV